MFSTLKQDLPTMSLDEMGAEYAACQAILRRTDLSDWQRHEFGEILDAIAMEFVLSRGVLPAQWLSLNPVSTDETILDPDADYGLLSYMEPVTEDCFRDDRDELDPDDDEAYVSLDDEFTAMLAMEVA
jgi:hypothetical protein